MTLILVKEILHHSALKYALQLGWSYCALITGSFIMTKLGEVAFDKSSRTVSFVLLIPIAHSPHIRLGKFEQPSVNLKTEILMTSLLHKSENPEKSQSITTTNGKWSLDESMKKVHRKVLQLISRVLKKSKKHVKLIL